MGKTISQSFHYIASTKRTSCRELELEGADPILHHVMLLLALYSSTSSSFPPNLLL